MIASADSGAPPVRAEASRLAGKFDPGHGLGAPGNDIDDGKKSACTIQRGTRPPHDLNPFDQCDVQRKLGAQLRRVVDVVVEAVPVDQQEDLIVIPTGPGETPHVHVSVVTVIRDVETPHTAQGIRQRPVAEPANLVSSDDGHCGRRLPVALQIHRGAIHLNFLERLGVQIHDVRVLFARRCRRANAQPQQQPNPTGPEVPKAAYSVLAPC